MFLPSAFHLVSQSTPLPGQGSNQAMLEGQGRSLCLRDLMQVVRAVTAVGFWKKRLKAQAAQGGVVLLVLAVVKLLLDELAMPMPVKMSL